MARLIEQSLRLRKTQAYQASLWSALPPDIGSEPHPRLCCAIEGGLSSRMITVKSPKTQRVLPPAVLDLVLG